jgi:hypothetical protein
MGRATTTIPQSIWAAPAESASSRFADGRLWIGEHSGDGDLLVFDPASAELTADRLSFYSLTQLRNRVFPRRIAAQWIHELTDELRSARARKDYDRRSELQAEQEQEQLSARSAQVEANRAAVLELHRRFVEGLGLEYRGVESTPEGHRSRRSRCHSCGIALDDFADSVCVGCKQVLCSCGGCSCDGAIRAR